MKSRKKQTPQKLQAEGRWTHTQHLALKIRGDKFCEFLHSSGLPPRTLKINGLSSQRTRRVESQPLMRHHNKKPTEIQYIYSIQYIYCFYSIEAGVWKNTSGIQEGDVFTNLRACAEGTWIIGRLLQEQKNWHMPYPSSTPSYIHGHLQEPAQ